MKLQSLRRIAAASVVSVLVFMTLGQAAEIPGEADLTQCMLENTQEVHKTAMRKFIVAALEEDRPAYTAAANEFAVGLIQVISPCGVAITDFENPNVLAAVEKYGQILGEQIMTEAMAKMGEVY